MAMSDRRDPAPRMAGERRRGAARNRSCGVLSLLLAGSCLTALAGGGPENTLLVVNGDSWASLTVANEYADARRIPSGNVLCLNDLPDIERLTVGTFRKKVLGPVLTAIEERGLGGQIDCILYSSDIPFDIDFREDLGQAGTSQVVGIRGSLTGLTFLHAQVMAGDAGAYTSRESNRTFRRPVFPGGRRQRARAWPKEELARVQRMHELLRKKEYAQAAELHEEFLREYPRSTTTLYNLACCRALLGEAEKAAATLAQAVDAGWMNWELTLADKDLTSLRERQDFRELVDHMKAAVGQLGVEKSIALRGRYRWDAEGERTTSAGGTRYMLSAMLAATSGRGNSVEEVSAFIRRSAWADGTRPDGTVHFMTNGDVRTQVRRWAFKGAVTLLEQLGVRAEVTEGNLPEERHGVAGVMAGSARLGWKPSEEQVLAGAICEHLTSCGGMLHPRAGQSPLTEFIRHGAAGASGTVTEPLAIQAKFPLAFLHVHYARGCSLAEAFYQAVQSPYQLLIVGDPLCQPWARIPEVELGEHEPADPVSGVLTLRPRADAPAGASVARFELFVDGTRRLAAASGEAIRLNTRDLGDGYHDVRVVAVCREPIETRGRVLVPLRVANSGTLLETSLPSGSSYRLGQTVEVRFRLPGAREVRFRHLGRDVATVKGNAGAARIDTRSLGLGPVTLYPNALLGNTPDAGPPVRGSPIRLRVDPPPPVAALAQTPAAELEKGVVVTLQDGTRVPVAEWSRGWLAEAGVGKDETFVVQGLVQASLRGTHQVQVRTSATVTVSCNGKVIDLPDGPYWRAVPFPLGQGWHRFVVEGRARGEPDLQVRMACRGTWPLVMICKHEPLPTDAPEADTDP